MRRLVAVLLAAAALAACTTSSPPDEPLKLDGNLLTIDNRSNQDWTGVEVWLNTYYRSTAKKIPAHGRMNGTLDAFVAGHGERFDFHRMQVRDLRLTAKLPDGSPIEIKKAFSKGALADSFKGLGGKR